MTFKTRVSNQLITSETLKMSRNKFLIDARRIELLTTPRRGVVLPLNYGSDAKNGIRTRELQYLKLTR